MVLPSEGCLRRKRSAVQMYRLFLSFFRWAPRRKRRWKSPRTSNCKQQVFLTFRFLHYVSVGVGDLGNPEEIGRVFTGFQRYLYSSRVA